MKNIIKKFMTVVTLIILTSTSLHYLNNRNYYKSGENANLNHSLNEKFIIELDENPSTGYSNCWLNNKKLKHIKLIKNEYKPSLNSKLGADGAGGTTIYTFETISKGIDTLKVASCPIAIENKDCDFYTETNSKPDNVFIIKVR